MKRSIYLYVTPFFPSPTNWRGSYCYDFVKALMRTGKYDVCVFVPEGGSDYEIGGVTVHRFATRQLPSGLFPFLFQSYNECCFLHALERTGINIVDVAVCHGHNVRNAIYPLAVKRKNPRCLTLLHHHDLQSFGLNMGRFCHCWFYNVFLYLKLRKLHEQIDCHVFISKASRNSFLAVPDTSWTDYALYRKQYRGLSYLRPPKIKRSLLLNNGVDTEVFYPRPDRNQENNPKFTIGCIANFVDWKDQMLLLQAAAALQGDELSIKLIFIGTGPYLRHSHEYARDHGLDVEFRNEVMHEKLREFYWSIDLFVLPSYMEGFGCVYTEAVACGVPIIGVRGQGIADVIDDEWLIRPHDLNGLIHLIRRFYSGGIEQKMKSEIRITPLVDNFVTEIECLRKGLDEKSNC